MRSDWFARLFFAVVAVMAVAGIVSGTACTRWGHPGSVPPTLTPISSIYVDAHTGSDTSGNGSQTTPYKTLTKAVNLLATSKSLSPSGVTIFVSSGDYNAANGERFPIVIPKSVTISGTNYGAGPKAGTFIDGQGEDTTFEHIVDAPAHSVYTTLEVDQSVSVSVGNVYVGSAKISLPGSQAFYVSFDDLGTASASVASFGAGIVSTLRNVNGVLVAGGQFSCSSCDIKGNDFGIGGLSVPGESSGSGSGSSGSGSGSGSGPSQFGPTIDLTHPTGDSTIEAKVVNIITDGSVNVTASGERFLLGQYAYEDTFPPVIMAPRGAIDFGGGAAQSTGGNNFIGAHVTEIGLAHKNETVSALDDTWNPNQQHSNQNGTYTRKHTFAPGASGKNVTIAHDASGSTVTVGPAVVPTPTPSSSPTGSPTSTPT